MRAGTEMKLRCSRMEVKSKYESRSAKRDLVSLHEHQLMGGANQRRRSRAERNNHSQQRSGAAWW